MKLTKKLLALLLTLALALSLALPAMAAVNWDEFHIITQPQSMTVIRGDSFTLSVEVNVPDGAEVEYQWRRGPVGGSEDSSTRIYGATEPDLQISSNDDHYPFLNNYYDYYCEITAYEKDAGDTVLSSQMLTSDRARVTPVEKEKTFWEKVYSVTLEPFEYAGSMTLIGMMLSFGLLLPVTPFYFLYFLVVGYIEGFKGLF